MKKSTITMSRCSGKGRFYRRGKYDCDFCLRSVFYKFTLNNGKKDSSYACENSHHGVKAIKTLKNCVFGFDEQYEKND